MYIPYKSWPKESQRTGYSDIYVKTQEYFHLYRILSPLLHLISKALRGSGICQGLQAQDMSFKTGHLKDHVFLCICTRSGLFYPQYN